ncbi:type I-F CRISPR-associated protein Csy1 [Leptothrix ochracea]|uniref:type I-F CRISPR-associated protein Csy1 n=1 Tax=Leptothrix ochracea TaxID=735331 RepID=UPI0034E2A0C6
MPNTDHQRQAELRTVIQDFLTKRRDDKLEKIKDDDPKQDELRQQLHQQFQYTAWLEDAAKRVDQIQAVTHSLKPVHPDAKGTNLYSLPSSLAPLSVVGSHCLGEDFAGDVVGNAAALDVYKFLKLSHNGQSLLTLILAKDADLAAALSDDPTQAQTWISAFAGIVEPRGRLASHTLAKQLYWLTGTDPHDDASYRLLAPLYASSLAHRVYETLQDDRFSDAAKAAREAKKAGTFSERAVHEYPQLAIQQLGGTKPQNISQLNSERRGNNNLLASLPPVWRSAEIQPLLKTESMFHRYSRRPEVKQNLKALLAFLKSDPARNLATRQRRAEWVSALIDEFLQFTAELRSLPAGWSQSPDCHLSDAETRWLDPAGCAQADAVLERPTPIPPADTAERISSAFANWLNAQLLNPLPMGDPEFMAWRNEMQELIQEDEREGRDAD